MTAKSLGYDDAIEITVRAVGTLSYSTRGAEFVRAGPSSLGSPSDLVGIGIEAGHQGSVIGRIVSARVSDDGQSLVAVARMTPAGLAMVEDGTLVEASCEYTCDVDANGVQRSPKFLAVALVGAGMSRCGSACSVTPPEQDTAGMHVRQDARDDEIEPWRIARARSIARASVCVDMSPVRPRAVVGRDGAYVGRR